MPQGHAQQGGNTIAGVTIAAVITEILPDAANPQLLVRVTDSDGNTGAGETWWGTYQPDAPPGDPVRAIAVFIDSILAPVCVGASIDSPDGNHAADIAARWADMHRAVSQYGPEGVASIAMSGVDLALWDLVAKRRGAAVADLIGDRLRDLAPAYASLSWLGHPDAVVNAAESAIEHGFRAVKLHEADPDLILEVRRRLGDEISIMLDVSGRWVFDEAQQAIRTLEPAQLTWIEEPIYPYTDHHALASLRSLANTCGTALAAGENEFSVAGFGRLLDAGAVDVVQPDLVKCGGLSVANQIGELARAADVSIAPHNFSLGPSLLANFSWAVVESAVDWLEVPWLGSETVFPFGMSVPSVRDGLVDLSEFNLGLAELPAASSSFSKL